MKVQTSSGQHYDLMSANAVKKGKIITICNKSRVNLLAVQTCLPLHSSIIHRRSRSNRHHHLLITIVHVKFCLGEINVAKTFLPSDIMRDFSLQQPWPSIPIRLLSITSFVCIPCLVINATGKDSFFRQSIKKKKTIKNNMSKL